MYTYYSHAAIDRNRVVLRLQASCSVLHKDGVGFIKEIMRTPFTGTGRPAPLKHELSGCWSRRITQEHRLVYQVTKEMLIIVSCKFHY